MLSGSGSGCFGYCTRLQRLDKRCICIHGVGGKTRREVLIRKKIYPMYETSELSFYTGIYPRHFKVSRSCFSETLLLTCWVGIKCPQLSSGRSSPTYSNMMVTDTFHFLPIYINEKHIWPDLDRRPSRTQLPQKELHLKSVGSQQVSANTRVPRHRCCTFKRIRPVSWSSKWSHESARLD